MDTSRLTPQQIDMQMEKGGNLFTPFFYQFLKENYMATNTTKLESCN